MLGFHVDTTFINMHNTPKVSAEGQDHPQGMAAKGEGHCLLYN